MIENNITDELNDYLNDYFKSKFLKKDNKKKKKREKLIEKENKEIKISVINDLHDQIQIYKKLKKNEKEPLNDNFPKTTMKILSKAVIGMCNYLIPQEKSAGIINHFFGVLEIDPELYIYLQNLLYVNSKNKENSEEKNRAIINNSNSIILILSKAAIFLERKMYVNLLQLNKFYNKKLKSNLFKIVLSKHELPINDRIKIWDVLLNINSVRNKFNYLEAKNKVIKLENGEEQSENYDKKAMSIIDLDLVRTPLFRKDNESKLTSSIILKSLRIVIPDFEYFQGMNLILLFFYQLLDRNEEKIFHYFCALKTNTEYNKIFDNELTLLKRFLAIYSKIVETDFPEIYYKLHDRFSDYYCSSWFITLFTCFSDVFKQEGALKYVLLAFETFLIDGWSAIFCSSYTLIMYFKEKILNSDGDKFMEFMIKILDSSIVVKNEDFKEFKELFMKNEEKINKEYLDKFMAIIECEETKPILKNK